jgi:hypothetical protein
MARELKKQLVLILFMAMAMPVVGQWINPVTTTSVNTTVTYYFDSEVNYIGAKWTATNGVVDTNSLQLNGTTYSVSVQWTVAGAGVLNFQSKNTVISSLNVAICGLTNFNLIGGSIYCRSGGIVTVTLSGSQAGVNYQLYKAQTIPFGAAVAGTGGQLSWNIDAFGTGLKIGATQGTGCSLTMNGGNNFDIIPMPTIYTVSGGGGCVGESNGYSISLSGSQPSTSYRLQLNGNFVGNSIFGGDNLGNSIPITWSNISASGTYTVVANASFTCTQTMNGTAVVNANPPPTIFTVGGGGSYCEGGDGLSITLDGSQPGVNYQLKLGNDNVGSVVSGNGSGLSWQNIKSSGNYSVVATNATTLCTQAMSGTATISISGNAIANVGGGGTFCEGGTGVSITLDRSNSTVSYQLKVNGANVGDAVTGISGGITWANQTTEGFYTVWATNSSGCVTKMSGTSYVSTLASPFLYTISGGGSFCSGGTGPGVLIADYSQANVNYSLYKNGGESGRVYYGNETAPFKMGWSNITQEGTYTILATLPATGCTRLMSGSVAVVEKPTPTVPILTNATVCGSGTITGTLPANATTLNWYTAPSGGQAVASTTSPSATSTTTFYASGYNSTTTCESARTPVTLTVNPLPVDGQIAADVTSICLGTSINISSSGGVGAPNYWASTNGGQSWNVFAQAYAGQTSFQFTPTEAGTYRFHLRNQTSCGFCWTFNNCPTFPYVDVVVNPKPQKPFFGRPISACVNGSASYQITTPTAGSNYAWTINGGTQSSGGTGSSITVLWGDTNSGSISVYETNSSGCKSLTLTSTVTLLSLPTFASTLDGPTTVCPGATGVTYSIAPVSGSSYTWAISGGTQASGTNTNSITVNWDTERVGKSISVQETNSSGCVGSALITPIGMSLIPTIPTGTATPAALCAAGTVELSSSSSLSGSESFNWYQNESWGSPLSSTTQSIATTTTFYVSKSNSYCESERSPVTVTVSPVPTVPTLSDNTVCGSGTIVGSLPANATTLNWYTAPSGGQAVASTTSPSATSTTTFYVSGYNSTTTCESTRTPVTLTVNPLPEDGQIAADVTAICLGSTINISSSGGVGTPNYWASTNEGQSWNVFGQAYVGETSFQFTPTEAGTYRFHLRNQTSCGFCGDVGNCTTYPYVDVVVNPIPAVPELSDYTVCGSGTIAGNLPANATTLNWYTAPSGGQAVASTTSPLATSTTTFYTSGYNTDAACESARTPVTLTVNPLPAAPVVSSSVVCGQGSLIASDAADASTNWYDAPTDGTLLATGAVSPQATQTSTFYASYSAAGCESARTGGTVTVIPLPTINATNNGQLTYGSLVTLSTASADTYRWQLNGQNVSTAASFVADKIGTYTLAAKQDAGSPECTSLPVQVKSFLAAQPAPVNYTSTTRILKKGVSETASLYSLAQTDVNQSVTYQDGLGRTFQQVAVGLSPQQTDLVTPVGYGKQGLVDSTFLPYATTTRQGLYRPNAIRVNNAYTGSEQQQFYQNTAKVAADAKPYARAVHRAALDARVTEQGAPGAAWQPGSGHTATSTQVLNTASYPVRFWKFDGTTTENYPINTVLVTITTDENGNQVRTYTNKQGQTVLKQVQLDDTISGGMVNWLETYYIYDPYGRLAYQLPPRAVKALGAAVTLNANNVPELIYKYTYDTRGRLTQQKVPGAAVKFFVYDKLNRLVLSQDGNQRAQNAWAFIKYDVYQRPVYSGIYTNTVQTTLSTVQTLLNNIANTVANSYETPLANAAATLGYSNVAFPTTGITIMSASYYDGYDFDQNGTADYTYDKTHLTGLPATAAQGYAVRNLPTGSKKLVMGTATWLTSAVFYDDYDRPVQTLSGNHLNPTGMDKASMVYDFVGRVLNTKTTHTGVGTVTVAQRYTYDQAGRTKGIYHRIDNTAERQVAAYEYNALGQLVDKKLHVSGTTALQSVDMRYTIRGWLKSINNATLSSDAQTNDETNDYFGMELLYETVDTGLTNVAQYNGNVTAAKWKGPGLGTGAADQRSYTYGYDKADKLKTASFKAFTDTTWTKEVGTLDETMTYDHNGNLLTLARRQNQRALSGTTVTSTAQLVDNLTYTYTSNTNRMLKVEDAVATTIRKQRF